MELPVGPELVVSAPPKAPDVASPKEPAATMFNAIPVTPGPVAPALAPPYEELAQTPPAVAPPEVQAPPMTKILALALPEPCPLAPVPVADTPPHEGPCSLGPGPPGGS